ncbi:SDR family NAD(P)-dependent oxidoreductase [Dongia sp.]|uniref:SDR family NAD(P)-dependent oxidoreductase n=1 Tax=Dongia sp. TaxID=1977262 RepID=UPI0037514D2F
MAEGDFYSGKRVVVTGAAGTVGSRLIRRLLQHPIAELRALDNHENGLFRLSEELKEERRFHPFMCDIRSPAEINSLLKGMDYCFHTAALKHVPSSERAPFETVQTNIMGVQNLIQSALANGLQRVLLTSSDKAVNPTNVMGTTKLMGERLITAANATLHLTSSTVLTSTRFGNVLGSAGSFVPLFCGQIARGGPVTLTDRSMTRFVMTLDESVRLVLKSIELACGGEVFVTKMPVVRISDVAEELVELVAPLYGRNPAKIEIREIGPRPGEKMFEELTSDEELRRTVELDELFAVIPAFRNIYDRIEYAYPPNGTKGATRTYNSANEPVMTRPAIRKLLLEPDVLPPEVSALVAVKSERGVA